MEREELENLNTQVNNTYNGYNTNQTIYQNQNNYQQPTQNQTFMTNNTINENLVQSSTIYQNQNMNIEKEISPEKTNEEPKIKNKIKLFKKKNNDNIDEDTIKPLVTSRVLFISIIDKIYLITIILSLIILTYINFKGNISSLSYRFFDKLRIEININNNINNLLCNIKLDI